MLSSFEALPKHPYRAGLGGFRRLRKVAYFDRRNPANRSNISLTTNFEELPMSYDETTHPPASHISPRKEGFNFLPPPPDFTLFRYEAAVDWLEVEIETETPTQPWTVADKLGIPHSKLVDDGPGHAEQSSRPSFKTRCLGPSFKKALKTPG